MRESLTVILFVKEALDLPCRSDDLSVDLSSSLASVVSSEAVDRRVYLIIELAHVVAVKDSYLISFFGSLSRKVLFVARNSCLGSLESVESLLHTARVSTAPFLIDDGINHTLKMQN